jgi:hypothetical protein
MSENLEVEQPKMLSTERIDRGYEQKNKQAPWFSFQQIITINEYKDTMNLLLAISITTKIKAKQAVFVISCCLIKGNQHKYRK